MYIEHCKLYIKVFQKDTLKKWNVHPSTQLGGTYVRSSNPEGNADRTSLRGWQSDLKFGKTVGGVVTMASSNMMSGKL